ncbi:MAG: hypothetical protein AAGA27_04825 [Pseudomonadota bacterium]
MAIFGGTAPVINAALIHLLKTLYAPAIYVMAISIVGLVVVCNIRSEANA